eukprot:jgi/Mesvir1/606/Mv02040-RA.2
MSDDDEELRELRKARSAQRGGENAGPSASSRESLLERQRRMQALAQRDSSFFAGPAAGQPGGKGGGPTCAQPSSRAGARGGSDDDEDAGPATVDDDDDDDDGPPLPPLSRGKDDDDFEDERFDGLRGHFPMAFGKSKAAPPPVLPIHVHEKTKRVEEKAMRIAGASTALGGDAANGGPPVTTKLIGAALGGLSNDANSQKLSSAPPAGPGVQRGVAARPFIGLKAAPAGAEPPFGSPESVGPPRPPSGNDLRESSLEVGPPRPPQGVAAEVDDDDEPDIGPPRPPPGKEDSPDIGPPRPPLGGGEREASPDIGPPRPPGGSGSGSPEVEIGPPRPKRRAVSDGQADGRSDEDGGADGHDSDDDDDDDDADEERLESDPYRMPLGHEIVLKGHRKVVTAVAVDPSGARVITGSTDYTLRMYDFGGMDARLKSFRQLEPFEAHPIRGISWSPTGDRFLVVSGSAKLKVFDRDGCELGESLRGDMYLRDAKNTKGHITGVTAGCWHPKDKETFLSSSEDGTLRVWNAETFTKGQAHVIKPKLPRPGRVAVTTCSYSPDGKLLGGALQDGSLQVWANRSYFGGRPDHYLEDANTPGEDTSCICFSEDGHTVLTRCTDGVMKIWDLRAFKSPVKLFEGIPTRYPQSNVCFSPGERLIAVPASADKSKDEGGALVLFDRDSLSFVRRVGFSEGSAVCASWHAGINQIFVGVGTKKYGATHVLYDPTCSQRGALLCMARAPRKDDPMDVDVRPVIHNPHALPLFREEPSRKRSREKARADPIKSRRPELPVKGQGKGGRVGVAKGTLLTQYLLKVCCLQAQCGFAVYKLSVGLLFTSLVWVCHLRFYHLSVGSLFTSLM